jgi:polyribonucleotide nucleotidyltransferase
MRVNKVEDVVHVGDEITVMVTGIDQDSGKIRLSRQAVLEDWSLEEAMERDSGGRSRSSGGHRQSGSGNRDHSRRRNDPDKNRRR